MYRKIEITTVERERIVRISGQMFCQLCHRSSEFLTVAQAAAVARVKTNSIRRWLGNGKAHGIRTCGGQHRVCKNSLFQKSNIEATGKAVLTD